ncbi:endonuclease-reverse transcriptase [Elysia marginata]|uniref:Endonuclease-reverse transcriptase n=1 Tax=Elysia marginata TaxID=1093978 RepID=A0AAV4HWE5_9GAST|nr:endonuclease-reverse transcriptase [Elysia marginata]
MSKSRHPLIVLTWNPQGARKKGRPQGTWRRPVKSEREESGKLNWLALDRCERRKFVGALHRSQLTSSVPYALKRTMDN